jgi:hypothetical protein
VAPLVAEPRPLLFSLQLDLLGNAERVIDLDTEIADRAFELCMSKQKLNRSEVTCLLIDLRCLRPPHRMRAVGGAIEPGALDPVMDDPRILSRRQVRLRPKAAREDVVSIPRVDPGEPVLDRRPGLLGDFKLHRPACLLLDYSDAMSNPSAGANIVELYPHEIAASELAIYGEIEQGEVALPMLLIKG